MRARHKPWAESYINENPDVVIQEPERLKGRWAEEFGNDSPIHIEVGTGKGRFITGMAEANPDINYIGIEMFRDIIVTAVQRADEADKPANLRLLNVNAERMEEIFAPGEVGRVYLNFSDPWPKARHAKRRLTHDNFLVRYERILPPEGEVHFKTDNRGLFEYSLMNMTDYGMKLTDVSLDLHADMPEWNIMTEYEEKFSSKGQPIYRLEAAFRNEGK